MLTKGIIKSINGNQCTVEMPVFDASNGKYKSESTNAIMCVPPGIYGGYKVNDVVIIGFDANYTDSPVILGRLYVNSSAEVDDNMKESKNKGSYIRCRSLVIDNSEDADAESYIPKNTRIIPKNSENQTTTNSTKNSTITSVTNNIETIGALVDTVVNNKASFDIYQKNSDKRDTQMIQFLTNFNTLLSDLYNYGIDLVEGNIAELLTKVKSNIDSKS